MNGKWLKLEALRKIIYSRFDFNDGIDFTICKLKKAVNELVLVVSKISSREITPESICVRKSRKHA
jgi:hypothetical protein